MDELLRGCAYSGLLLLATLGPPAIIINETPRSSPLRILWLPVFVYTAKEYLSSLSGLGFFLIHTLICGQSMIAFFNCFGCLVIRRHDAQALQGVIHKPSDGFVRRVLSTILLFLNLRGLKTPWITKNPPAFPRFYAGQKPGKAVWVLRQVLIMSWEYLFMEFVDAGGRDAPPNVTAEIFAPGSEWKYLTATPTQWTGRILTGLIWVAPGRAPIDMLYRALSVVMVVSGLTEPEHWPPLFGSILDAYTLRGFWSNYWHQFCRMPLTTISNHVARDILRLPRPSLLERYSNLTIVFFLSGVIHVFLDLFSGTPFNESGAFPFFTFFAVGIMLEDAAQELRRRLFGADKDGDGVPLWRRLVGYVWVLTWFIMTTAWYVHPVSRLDPEHKNGLPPIVVSRVGMGGVQAILVGGGLALKFALGGEL